MTHCPSLDQVTPGVLEHWSGRAREAVHPLLRFRYANLVWDLSGQITAAPRPHPDLARVVIDSSVLIADSQLHPHLHDVHRKLARTHELAMALNDPARVRAVREAVITYEEQTSEDHLPGT